MKNLQTFINYIGSTRARQRRNIMLTATLSVLVLFLVSILLTKPADSMSGQLICDTQVHIHDESCRQLVCTLEEHICDENCSLQECTMEHICDENCQTTACTLIHECDESCPPTDCPLDHVCDENCVIPECTEIHECDESCITIQCTPHRHSNECYELTCKLEEHEHSQECYEIVTTTLLGTYYGNRIQVLAEDQSTQWFDEAPTVLPTPAMNVNSSLIKEGTDYTSNFTGIVSQNGSIIDKNPVQFQIAFRLEGAILNEVRDNDIRYLYYPLPEGIDFQTNTFGSNCVAKDQNGIITAYYTLANNIDGTNYIIFRITDEYFTTNLKNTSNYTCKILFDTFVYRDESSDEGDRTVTLGTDKSGTPITDTVNFAALAPSMVKNVKIIETEGQKPVIEWEIIIKNPAKYASVNGYTLTDDMLSQAIDGNITVNPSGIFDDNWTLTRDIEDDETVTVTYRTAVDDSILNSNTSHFINNTANLTKDNETLPPASNYAYLDMQRNLSKSAVPDYRVAGEGIDYKLIWTITAENKYLTPLGGYSLIDDAFTSASDIVLKDKDGNVIPATDYQVNDNTITLNKNVTTSKITVTYKAPFATDSDNKNTVTLLSDDSSELKKTDAHYYGYYDPFDLSKSGTFNSEDNKVYWEIYVKPTDYSLLNVDKLILSDPAFSEAIDFNIIGINANWQEKDGLTYTYLNSIPVDSVSDTSDETETPTETLEEIETPTEALTDVPTEDPAEETSETPQDTTEEASVTTSAANSKTDIIQIHLSDDTITMLKITYATKPTQDEQAKIDAAEYVKFENPVQLNMNNYSESTIGIAEYVPVNQIIKTLAAADRADAEFELGEINSESKKNLNWTVEIAQDTDFSVDSKAFVDVMQALDKTVNPAVPSTEADHYISPSQRTSENIKVYGKVKETDSWSSELNTSYYEIVYYTDTDRTYVAGSEENVRSFQIKFNSSIDDLNYKYIKIEYQTTADISNVQSETNISFNNTASFNNKESTPYDSYEVKIYDNNVQTYSKHAIDKKGNELENGSTVNSVNVIKDTINGTEYYIFGWKINIDPKYASTSMSFTDTFDSGFTLCTTSPYMPVRYYKNYDGTLASTNMYFENYYEAQYGYQYYEGESTVKFTNFSYTEYFVYYTKIPVSELDQRIIDSGITGFKVSNTFVDTNNKYKPVSANIKVIKQSEVIKKNYIPHTTELVDGIADIGDNKLSYKIDINPDAMDLSNGDELILKDVFMTTKLMDNFYSQNYPTGPDLADVRLNKMFIYEIHPDGSESLLPANDYSYQYFEEGQETVTITPTKIVQTEKRNWLFKDLMPGDEVTVTLKAEPNFSFDKNVGGWGNGQNYLGYGFEEYTNIGNLNENAPLQFDSNGEYSFTVIVPDGRSMVRIYSWATDLEDANATVSRKTSSSELHLIIPDATHLRIEYVYTLLKDGAEIRDKIIGFTNTATLIGNETYQSTVDENLLKFSYDAAQATITYYPTIKKLDVADRAIEGLEAQFKLAMYDTTASKWKWYSQTLTNQMTILAENWVDSPDSIQITTVPGKLEILGLIPENVYALVEVQEPTNIAEYTYEDADVLDPFYFVYGSTPSIYPQGINNEQLSNSNVKTIIQNGEISVTNNRIINVNVVKQWDEPQTNAPVEVELYWSYTKTLNGFPSDMKPATEEDLNLSPGSLTNPVSFTDTYTWSSLPNGKDGKPIYYYVKEKSYTIEGTKYQVGSDNAEFVPLYKGNALNDSNSVIEITNASSLQVKKLWYDYKNNPLPENYTQEIEFKLWGRIDKDDDEVLITNGDSETFKINAENGWKYKFSTSLIENYNYFRIEEVNIPDGFTPSYNENYEKQSGIITIINKNPDIKNPSTSIIVEKTWNDGGYATRPEDLDLVLMSSTNKSDWHEVEMLTPVPEKNGNVWTYTYSNLPYRDDNSNIIYYKISEPSVNGYTLATTINNDGISSGTIKLVNNKILTLSLQKNWSDLYKNEHTGSKVSVNIYRAIDSVDVNNVENSEFVQTVEIKSSDNWMIDIENLPACNENGILYYYWVMEDAVSGYDTTYKYNNCDTDTSVTQNNGTVTINNNYIYEPVELPSTGGPGKTIYYIMGMIAIVIGCTLYIAHYIKYEKRRKEN